MFREWFDIEYRSMVWDMGSDPFLIDDFDDELDEGLEFSPAPSELLH